MSEKDNVLIIISGPTAVGKTVCTLHLARRFNADIISADSRQFYREMNIGTAKPNHAELTAVPHHFIDHLSIHEHYDVGIYEKEVIKFLSGHFLSKNFAILTGGTGLYIKAVVDGLDEFPDIPVEITKHIQSEYEHKGIAFLQAALKTKDPVYYNQVDRNNPNRLIRALAVIAHSQKTFSSFLGHKKKSRDFKPVFILLERDRDELYDRINLRVDEMVDQGLLDEAKSLFPYRHLKSLQTVGYQELFDHFEGYQSLEEAISLIKRNSRRYAKRQLTWFRKDSRWNGFHPDDIDTMEFFIKNAINMFSN